MHKTSRFAVAVLLGLCCLRAAPVVAEGPTTLQEARALAAESGVPVLIDFFATWCGPCKVFDRDSQQNPPTAAALQGVILFKIDGESPEGRPLAQKYQLSGFPTFVLLTADGETIHQWSGYNRKIFLENLDAGLKDAVPIDERQERFGSSPTAEDALVLATYNWTRGDVTTALSYYERADELNQDPAVDYSTTVFVMAYKAYGEGQATSEQVVRAGNRVLQWEGRTPVDGIVLARYMATVARNENDPDIVAPFLKVAFEETADLSDPQILKMRKGLSLEYTLYVEKDADAALALYKERLPENWQQNAQALNAVAWWCFENRIHLEEAEQLALSGVDLAESGQDKAMLLDTLAEICNLRGNCDDAVHHIEQAIREDPDRPHYREQLERFQKEQAKSR